MHKNQVEHTRKFRDKRSEQGLVQVTVWVPVEYSAKLKADAREAREKALEEKAPQPETGRGF